MEVEVGIGGLHAAFERRVMLADGSPVVREVPQGLRVEARVEWRVANGVDDRVEIGLAGEAGERGEGGIHHAGAALGGFERAGQRRPRRVVGVEVDRDADFSTQRRDQLARGKRLTEPRHVLDGEHMGPRLLELLRELHVVVERILRPLWIEDVAGVADSRLTDRTALDDGVDCHSHVRHPVERVEHAKHVDSTGRRLLHERLHDVVGVVRVADGIARPQQHLEEDVWNPISQHRQPIPGAFLQEPHRSVERGPAPHLQREEAGALPGVGVGHRHHVVRPHPRREE